MGKVCVATWGNPKDWKFAEYIYEELQKKAKAFSTLNILHEIEQPDKTIIIALDTLVDSDKLEECGSDYNCIEASVREKIKRYLCGIEAEVLVLPGVLSRLERSGNSGKRIKFSSDPQREFLPLLIHGLYTKLLGSEGKLEVALDISHGVNFMPTLAYRTVDEVAAALAVARVNQVKLRVYQADPYPLLPPDTWKKLDRAEKEGGDPCEPISPEEPPRVRYNKIAEATLKPWNLVRYMTYGSDKRILTGKGIPDSSSMNKPPESVLMALGAYRLGALLQLALLVKEIPIEDVERALKEAIERWKERRKVISGPDLEVMSEVRLSTGFYVLLHGHALLKGARKLLLEDGSIDSDGPISTFEEIKKLRELLDGSTIAKTLVNRELSKLSNLMDMGILTSDWKLYSDALREQEGRRMKSGSEPQSGVESKEVFQRNFIAHAGFHDRVVELRMKEGRLEIRMRPEGWEEIKDILKKAVEEN